MSSPLVQPLLIREFRPAYDLRALCALGGISFTAESVPYARCEATGDLPQVVHGSVVVGGPRAFAYIRTLAAARLGRQRSGDALASLAHGVLRDAELWSLYSDDAHFSAVTRPTMLRAMHAPMSLVTVPALRKACVKVCDFVHEQERRN